MLPDLKTSTSQLRKAIQRWRRSNGLPVPRNEDTEMTNFIQQQLAQHQQHAKNTLNIHMLKAALQERLPAGIIHCEDHFADRLIWYCPCLYHKCITGTFMNAEVFQTSEHQPLLLHEATHQRMLKRLPKHKWAFPNWGRIPTAYVLPKRKKDFATGRPIVSFVQAQGRMLWESFADVLSLMVRQACPDSFGEGSGVNQLHLIKQHFRSLSEITRQEHTTREDITCMNQDLAGFFTSISSDRFIDSYHLLLHWYQQRNTQHATTFTVAHSESLPDARVRRGSHKHISHTTTARLRRRSLHIHEFPDIISAILLYGGRQSSETGPGRANGISSVPSTMLHGRGCARTSMGQHVQKSSVQRQTPAARRTPPYHSRLFRHTLCGQQVNDDPHQNGHPPAFRCADPQRLLRSTRGTGNGARIRLPWNGAGSRPVCHTLHTSNPAERRSISTFRHRNHRATQRHESKTEASAQHVRATKRHCNGGSCSEGRIPCRGT